MYLFIVHGCVDCVNAFTITCLTTGTIPTFDTPEKAEKFGRAVLAMNTCKEGQIKVLRGVG